MRDAARDQNIVSAGNENLESAAAEWLKRFELRPIECSDGKDLRGRTVRVCAITSQADCEFFFPRRGLLFHQKMVKRVSAALRKRGATIERVTIDAEIYARWVDAWQRSDNEGLRYRFATELPDLLEPVK